MGYEEPFSDDVKELESALASLALRPSRIDRESIMFRAGWESAMRAAGTTRRSGRFTWCWPAATAVMTVATVGLAVLLSFRRPPEVTHQPVKKPRVAHSTPSDRAAPETREKTATRARHDQDALPFVTRWVLTEPPIERKSLSDRAGSNYIRLRTLVVKLGPDALLDLMVSPDPVPRSSNQAEPLRFSDLRRCLNGEDTL